MPISHVRTAAIVGCRALPVGVEVILQRGGQPKFTIIGLADNAIKESKDRVMSALQQCGFRLPERILVSLSPAELKKEGSSFDLPIAVGIVTALMQQGAQRISHISFHGELGLDGHIKGIRGSLVYALSARQHQMHGIIVPKENAEEAGAVKEIPIFVVDHLTQIMHWIDGREELHPLQRQTNYLPVSPATLDDVIGQTNAKRALCIAAAGGHNLL